MKEKIIIYGEQKKEKRDKIRVVLDKDLELRKTQLKILEESIINPIKMLINDNKRVRQSKITINEYVYKSEKYAEFVNEMFRFKNGKERENLLK